MSSKTARKKSDSSKPGNAPTEAPSLSLGNALGIAFVVVICAIALWGFFGQGAQPTGNARPVTPQDLARRAADNPQPQPAFPAGVPAQPPTRTGQPWEYDPQTDHHWDPRTGHQHWHQGPPPPPDQRAEVAQPTVTPLTPSADGSSPISIDPSPVQLPVGPDRTGTAWEYDAETDHHWDPRPGHEHWHRGQPPPEDQR